MLAAFDWSLMHVMWGLGRTACGEIVLTGVLTPETLSVHDMCHDTTWIAPPLDKQDQTSWSHIWSTFAHRLKLPLLVPIDRFGGCDILFPKAFAPMHLRPPLDSQDS
jgi:hypothetical protein